MQKRVNQSGKQIGRQDFSPSGPTVAHDKFSAGAQHVGLRREEAALRASLLREAIEELRELPPHAYERTVAEPILFNLLRVLEKKPSRTREEQEFILTMHNTWEKARAEGHQEGRAEGEARAVLTVLRARGIRVPKEVRERILAQKDPVLLNRWLKRAARATTAAEVFQEPN